MKLGRRGGRRTLQTPSNQGIARRAEARLAGIADSYVAKMETSLAVDGVPIVVWNKHRGKHKCLCRTDKGFHAERVDVHKDNTGQATTIVRSTKSAGRGKKRKYREVREGFQEPDTHTDDKFTSSARDKIEESDYAEVQASGYDYADSANVPSIDEALDPLLEADVALNQAESMISAKMIACPICLGSGFVDSWQPEHGTRLLLEMSGWHAVDLFGVDQLDTSVPTFELPNSDSYVEWELYVPVTWLWLARVTLFDGDKVIPTSRYRATLIFSDDTSTVLTEEILKGLRGNAKLAAGKATIRLETVGSQTLRFTHYEILYFNRKPTRAQLPEVEVPYEEEYIDWNLNISIEVSPKSGLKEGSYICDRKYKKVWKVDSFSRKQLADGQVFGVTANCRALHSFERLFTLFNIYV